MLTAHKAHLEIIRGVTSGPDLEALDRRIEAARLLLEWLAQALGLEPPDTQQGKRRRHQRLQLVSGEAITIDNAALTWSRGAGNGQTALLRRGEVRNWIVGSPRPGLTREQSGREFAPADATARA